MGLANDVRNGALRGLRLEVCGALLWVAVNCSTIAVAHVFDKLQRVSLAFSRAISSLQQ